MYGESEGKRTLVQLAMLDSGIAPVCPTASKDVMFFPMSASAVSLFKNPIEDARKYLASLPPEDQKKAKRKFRKLWRRALDREAKSMGGHAARSLRKSMTAMQRNQSGSVQPMPRAMHSRIHAVYRMFLQDVSKPSE
jgi:hypothetical protein